MKPPQSSAAAELAATLLSPATGSAMARVACLPSMCLLHTFTTAACKVVTGSRLYRL